MAPKAKAGMNIWHIVAWKIHQQSCDQNPWNLDAGKAHGGWAVHQTGIHKSETQGGVRLCLLHNFT